LDEPSANPILKGNRFNQAPGLTNAIRALHAIGGYTNAVIHLLAIAYELDLEALTATGETVAEKLAQPARFRSEKIVYEQASYRMAKIMREFAI
jgi:dihydroxyacid dehydratase/phosphogluconate dehydratase